MLDRDVRDFFSISETKLGDLTGKSRQAINIGLKEETTEKHYFKPHEWSLIYIYLKTEGTAGLEDLVAYIRSIHPEWQEPNIGGSPDVTGHALMQHRKIVCIISDFSGFKVFNPKCYKIILKLVAKNTNNIIIYVNSAFERRFFLADLKTTELVPAEKLEEYANIETFSEANQYPYIICGDPESESPAFYLCSNDVFLPMHRAQGATLYHFIRENLEKDRQPPRVSEKQKVGSS